MKKLFIVALAAVSITLSACGGSGNNTGTPVAVIAGQTSSSSANDSGNSGITPGGTNTPRNANDSPPAAPVPVVDSNIPLTLGQPYRCWVYGDPDAFWIWNLQNNGTLTDAEGVVAGSWSNIDGT